MQRLSQISLPDNHIFCGDIFGLAAGDLTLNIGCIQWRWYLNDEARSREFLVEAGLDRDDIRDTGGPNLVYSGQHFDGKLDV